MQVWTAARAGDTRAITMIVTMLRPRVERMGRYYARRLGMEGEELIQEGFVAMLEGFGTLGAGVEQPAAYLVRLARWRMLDHARRHRRRIAACLEHEPSVADLHLDQAGERMDVGAFLAGLPPRQAALADGLMAGLRWREVAACLGCSSANLAYHVKQIKAAYVRARARECA